LISFSFKLVSDQSLIGSGVASVRRKLPKIVGERMKLEPHGLHAVYPYDHSRYVETRGLNDGSLVRPDEWTIC
jgi:hypothetical protein